jgi:chemotaxis response regulator CheB
MKIRILSNSKKGKMQSFAEAIKAKYQLTANSIDTIPPAYQCDKERIVIVGASFGAGIPEALRKFAREMTKQKAQNMAIYTDGKEATAKELAAILKEAGTNVIDEIHYVKSGLPMFSKISNDEQIAMLEWVERVLSKLT